MRRQATPDTRGRAPWQTLMLIALVGVALLSGCAATVTTPAGSGTNATVPAGGNSTPGSGAGIIDCTPNPTAADCQLGPGNQDGTLYIEPAAAESPVVNAIQNAHATIDLEIYLLTDHSVINALENAANRGVKVRVMLEGHPYGSGSVSPQETIATLNAAGVTAKTANPTYHYTHAKMMILDGKTAVISSANFTKTALGGSSYGSDRDYMVFDPDAPDVAECEAIFNADWNRQTPRLSDLNLVVSPVNAREKLLALIASAKTTLQLEQEEMNDQQFIDALKAAAQRGVQVGLVVPLPSSGNSDGQNEADLMAAGVHVVQVNDRATHAPYIHAKIIIADNKLAYVGSENASSTSLNDNREMGILIANPNIIQQLAATYAQDAGGA